MIVDTVPAHYTAWKAITNELNIEFTEEDNEQLKGVSRIESMNRIMELGSVTLEQDEIEKLVTRKNDIYVSIISNMTRADILPGVMETLDLLKRNDIAAAVGSSSKNATRILESIGLTEEFEVIVDGNQIKNSKPDPEVFLLAAEKLGKSPEQCTVIEDAFSGVEAAKRGGMHCIGVGKQEVLNEADVVIPSMESFSLIHVNQN